MAHKDCRKPKAAAEVLQERPTPLCRPDVECREGLIEEQQVRVLHHRPRQSNPLSLPATQLARIAIDEGGDLKRLQHLI